MSEDDLTNIILSRYPLLAELRLTSNVSSVRFKLLFAWSYPMRHRF